MKRCATLLLLLFLLPAAVADAGKLSIYSDAAFTDSSLNDDAPRTVDLYVVHSEHDGATGVHFATVATAGFTGVWLSESTPYLSFGTSTAGIAVAYAACLAEPVLVLTMTYLLYGTSEACSGLTIGPAPGKPVAICLESGGCFSELPCNTAGIHVNCPVATRQATWGRVKSLYR